MSAAARKQGVVSTPLPIPATIDVFRERCEARAILVEACLFDLQDAVDGLQADAERTGLVDELGQDVVQKMLADAFAIVPRGFCHRDKTNLSTTDKSSLEATSKPHRPGAAVSTLRAADYLIQQKDPARLKTWLAKHTRTERLAIIKHIRGKR